MKETPETSATAETQQVDAQQAESQPAEISAPAETVAPEPAIAPATSEPAPPARRRDAVPYLYLGGLAALGLAVGWLWVRPVTAPVAGDTSYVTHQDLVALANRSVVDTLAQRVAVLENRPAPAMPVIPAAPDLAPLATQLRTMQDRVAALENRPAPQVSAPVVADTSGIASRQEALAARLQAAEAEQINRIGTAERTLTERLAALEARLGQAEALNTRLAAIENRMGIQTRLAAIRIALQAGQPLGSIQGAPAALARYATEAPPTLASLKLSFPAASRAAQAASVPPANAQQGVLESAWNRAQNLVTVRRGEDVIIGAPDAGLLESARLALEAGDLARVVTTLDRLQPAPAAAMAGWIAQAKALLAAQAALVALEAGGTQ